MQQGPNSDLLQISSRSLSPVWSKAFVTSIFKSVPIFEENLPFTYLTTSPIYLFSFNSLSTLYLLKFSSSVTFSHIILSIFLMQQLMYI